MLQILPYIIIVLNPLLAGLFITWCISERDKKADIKWFVNHINTRKFIKLVNIIAIIVFFIA